VVIASAIMYLRIPVVTSIVMPSLGLKVAVPMVCGAIACLAISAVFLHKAKTTGQETGLEVTNPLEFSIALRFGLFLAVIALAAQAVNHWFGSSGVYALAGVSGLSDVDPITLSLAQMAGKSLTASTAIIGISIATFANMVTKTVISVVGGGKALARYTVPAMAASVVAGGVGLAAVLTFMG
jgi:uncharacterized membrane protein (DUF4010 family)